MASRSIRVAVLSFMLIPSLAWAQLRIERVYAAPDAGIDAADAAALARKALESSERNASAFFPNAKKVQLDLGFIFTDGDRAVAIQSKASTGLEETVVMYWRDRAELEAQLPPMVFSLWARAAGLADAWRTEAPKPSLEISVARAASSYGADDAMPQSYASMTAGPSGGVFVAGLGFLVELNREMEPRANYGLDPANPYAYFYAMGSSASGAVLGMTSTGEFWSLKLGGESFQRAGSAQPPPSAFAVSPAGSPVFQDYTAGGFVTLSGRRREPVKLEGAPPVTMAALDYDEDGKLWYYDILSGMVRCYDARGKLLSALRLVAPAGEQLVPQRLHIRGAEFILSDSQGLAAFDRFGLPLWRIKGCAPAADPLSTSMLYGSSVGRDGALYVILQGGGLTLTRYDDRRSLEALRAAGQRDFATKLERAVELNAAVAADPDDDAAFEARAAFFMDGGFKSVELCMRLAMADAFPGARENAARLAQLQREGARAKALAAAAAVYGPLNRYGAETARAEYQKAMRLLERYTGANRDDREVAAAMAALGDAFRAREGGKIPARPAPLRLEARFDTIFPAFMERYRTVPAGTIRVINEGTAPASGLRLVLTIKEFLDFPAEFSIPGPLDPGASVDVPVTLALNRASLELREELTVNAFVAADAEGFEGRLSSSLRFLSRSALTWDDTAALASFVTPNDDAIVSFGHAALAYTPPPLFDRSFSRAFALVSALGARGLVYVEDPATPFSAASRGARGKDAAPIDTVRFPRATLASGAGDCDDTSALLLSCLEAVGVRTAILTSPGHVFVAFAAEAAPDGPGRYGLADGPAGSAPPFGSIAHGGQHWIPLESTVLSKGFAEAWKAGYAEARKAGEALEVMPLSEARLRYPALPLAGTPGAPPVPSRTSWDALAGAALKALEGAYAEPQRAVAAQAAKAGIKVGAEAYNNLGVRLVQLGDYAGAAEAFRQASVIDPGNVAARANLVVALDLSGDTEAADKALSEARKALPAASSLARLAERRAGSSLPDTRRASGQGDGERASGGSVIELMW